MSMSVSEGIVLHDAQAKIIALEQRVSALEQQVLLLAQRAQQDDAPDNTLHLKDRARQHGKY